MIVVEEGRFGQICVFVGRVEVEGKGRSKCPEVEEQEGLMKCSPRECLMIVHEISRGQLHRCLQGVICLYQLRFLTPVSNSQSINQWVYI